MKDLFERLQALLQMRKTDPQFEQFFAQIREQPLIEKAPDSSLHYRFLNSGFSLTIGSEGRIVGALLLIDNEATWNGFYQPFQGTPYGIAPGDQAADVELKLGVSPVDIERNLRTFHLPPNWLFFRFDEQTGAVKSLSIMKLSNWPST